MEIQNGKCDNQYGKILKENEIACIFRDLQNIYDNSNNKFRIK